MDRKLMVDGREHTASMSAGSSRVTIDGREHEIEVLEAGAHHLDMVFDGKRVVVFAASGRGRRETWVGAGGRARLVAEVERRARGGGPGGAAARLVTPMFPAVVVKVLVEIGQAVNKGAALLTVSAMKMEMTLAAPHAGVVTAINTREGANVSPGDNLVEIEEPAAQEGSDE
jgi:biotin carboxyl carrier protein